MDKKLISSALIVIMLISLIPMYTSTVSAGTIVSSVTLSTSFDTYLEDGNWHNDSDNIILTLE